MSHTADTPESAAPVMLSFEDERGSGVSRWIALGFSATLVIWMASPLLMPSAPPPEALPPEIVPVTVAVRDSVARRIPSLFIADGVARPDRRVALRAEMSGVIDTVEVRKGQQVAAGALLGRFRSARLEAQRDQALEELARATRELENSQALLARGAGTAVRVVEAQASLARARALEAETRVALSNAEIRAPFAGVIDAFDLEPGEYVDQGAAVGTVLDADPLSVAVEVPLQSFADLALGQTARVDFFPTGLRAEGALTFIGADASRESRTFPAEISVPNPDGAIPAGLSARVWIVTGESDAHLIAAATLTLGADGTLGVKTVDDADRVAFHAVTIERGAAGGAVWVSGLPDTARIVTIGQANVAPGEAVAPRPDVRPLAEILDQ